MNLKLLLPHTKILKTCLLGASLAWPGVVQAGIFKDPCANVPSGAQPAPAGTYINRFIQLQQAEAETDDFVLYKHMWYRGGTELGPLGRYQLEQIAKRLPTVPFPVVIETSKNEALDRARREAVISLLAMRGFADPHRIIVAFPIAEGLFGDEAPLIYNGLIGIGGSGQGGFGQGGYGGFGGLGGYPGFGLFGGGGFGGFSGFGGLPFAGYGGGGFGRLFGF